MESDEYEYERRLRRSGRLKQLALAVFALGVFAFVGRLIWSSSVDSTSDQPVELTDAERNLIERGLAEQGVAIGPDGQPVAYQLPEEIRIAILQTVPRSDLGACGVDLPRVPAITASNVTTPYVLHTLGADALNRRSSTPRATSSEPHEVFFVVEKLSTGRILGRAYLWSTPMRQIVCAGEVNLAALDGDLASLARAIPDALVAAGPSPAAARRAARAP